VENKKSLSQESYRKVSGSSRDFVGRFCCAISLRDFVARFRCAISLRDFVARFRCAISLRDWNYCRVASLIIVEREFVARDGEWDE
jgi:hypothetical protein